MIEHSAITHHIQKHIIDVLMFHQSARFRDLRPPKTDTNLFSYHLKLLIKMGLITKSDEGYTLSMDGLAYVDRLSSSNLTVRVQPKIITMFVVQNSEGDLLLWRRKRQPYINRWTLPYGKPHADDPSLYDAATRELGEKMAIRGEQPIRHVGDCYIYVTSGQDNLTTTLAHVFRFERDDIPTHEQMQWVRPHRLAEYALAPAVEEIVARTFFNDDFFFEEFKTTWQAAGEANHQ